jgi:(E)-4-hydroxy-3-methyl-but-2-enyl pyrophosphate reductase (IPP and DMAPP forming)
MKIILAQTAGFCMGVRRAVDSALEHAGKSPGGVVTLGPLIHNNQTIEMLKERKVATLDESRPIPPQSTILIRAHGVAPDVEKSYKNIGLPIVDGTCPKVKTVHKVIEKYKDMGYAIVITGDEGHAEVIGLQGYAGDAGHLVHFPADVDRLPHFEKLCLVSQTTFDKITFDEVAQRIKDRYAHSDVVIKKTICSATDQRQNETRELAARVDAMIVVGGKNSANTNRLVRIAEEVCPGHVQHVEIESEIKWEPLQYCKTVGITAGASTPNWMIRRVVEHLEFMEQTKRRGIRNTARSFLNVLSNLNVLVASGALFVYYASCRLQGLPPKVPGMAILFSYFLSMYLWNSLTNIENTKHFGLGRYRFYHAHKNVLYVIAGAPIVLVLVISFLQSTYLFYLMLFAVGAGLVYHLTIVPKFLISITRYRSLKDVPTSRDLFVALAWGILITFLPQVMAGFLVFSLSTLFCFFLFFILAFLRSLIFDLRDIEGDRIMGRETLVTIIGENRVRTAIQLVILSAIAALIVYPLIFLPGHPRVSPARNSMAFSLQAAPLLYLFIFMMWNKDNKASRSAYFNIFAEAQFFISGICAWLAGIV